MALLTLPAAAGSATVSAADSGCCTIQVNGPAVTMTVSKKGAAVDETFHRSVGQVVSEVLTGPVTSDQGCETLTLLSPDGNTVDSGSTCGNGNPVGVGPDKLAAGGKYTVLLQIDTVATGTSKLWVSIPVSRGTVTIGGPAEPVNVTRVGQGAQRTFHGSAGQRITAAVNGIATSDQGCETLTIYGPSGNTITSNSACGDGNPISAGPDRLGKTGTYTALYQVDNTATGTGKLKITT